MSMLGQLIHTKVRAGACSKCSSGQHSICTGLTAKNHGVQAHCTCHKCKAKNMAKWELQSIAKNKEPNGDSVTN